MGKIRGGDKGELRVQEIGKVRVNGGRSVGKMRGDEVEELRVNKGRDSRGRK